MPIAIIVVVGGSGVVSSKQLYAGVVYEAGGSHVDSKGFYGCTLIRIIIMFTLHLYFTFGTNARYGRTDSCIKKFYNIHAFYKIICEFLT